MIVKDLAGKVAVITGAASGIGLGMARRFASAGMNIALVDIEAEPLEKAAKELEAAGVSVMTSRVDVSKADQMDGLAKSVLDHFGGVHLVCNNAGVGGGGPMWDLAPADWEFVMGPNLWGVIHGIRVFTQTLIDQNEGHIVNTASMAGLMNAPGMGPYNMTKAGVVAISETLHFDLAETAPGVGVSVLCPGFVRTRIWDSERNRPDELQNPEPRASDEEIELMRGVMRELLEGSMPTEQVADLVHDAVMNGQFYIFTHGRTGAAVEQRMRRMVAGENPELPEGGIEVFTK
jgi:NAD(P)-dependent dehydrogenase (short-subunit alcohol dehydrogenase family)